MVSGHRDSGNSRPRVTRTYLRLDGFYWYDEVMHYDVDRWFWKRCRVYRITSTAWRTARIKFTGSPSTSPPGSAPGRPSALTTPSCSPIYAFDANASEQRIADTAALYKVRPGHRDESGGINDKYISQFRSYLTQGADDKLAYQNNSLIAWYTGTWGIAETSQNVSGTRYIYDAMHDFFSGIPTEMEALSRILGGGHAYTGSGQCKNTERIQQAAAGASRNWWTAMKKPAPGTTAM